VYVYLDDAPDTDQPEPDISALISEVRVLREQVEWMKAEAQRKYAILLNMTEAMKALAPPESPESPGPTDTLPRVRKSLRKAYRGPGGDVFGDSPTRIA
jgi:hypothetical protein